MGYAGKGVVYGLLGVLALQAVYFGTKEDIGGKKMVLKRISDQPMGEVLLLVIAVGLIFYVIWRLINTILNPGESDNLGKDVLQRIGYFLSALTYSGLILVAFRVIFGSRSEDSSGSKKEGALWLMEQPLGQAAVVVTGVIIICVGIFYFYRAYRASFVKKLEAKEMSGTEKVWAVRFGRVGISARAVIFIILGFLAIKSGINNSVSELGGYGNALQELLQQPYGPWLLGAVATGLILYSVYCFFIARYLQLRD